MDMQERADIFLFQLTVAGADRGYRSLDTFVGWFVGGTAAMFGLLVANLDKLSDHITADELSAIIPRLVLAFGLVLLAKFLGSLICTRAGALEKALEVSDAWAQNGTDYPDSESLARAREKALPLPLRWWFKLSPPEPSKQTNTTLWSLMVAGFSSLIAAGLVLTAWVELAATL